MSQVLCHSVITTRDYDTSYKSLKRRAVRQGHGPVSRWVLRGPTHRRVAAFGAVQLAFTVSTMVVGILGYQYFTVAVAWQVRRTGA